MNSSLTKRIWTVTIVAAVVLAVSMVLVPVLITMRVPHIPAWRDFEIGLPSGYSLVQMYTDSVCLNDGRGNLIVESNIDGYHVYTSVLVGHVSKESRFEAEKGFEPVLGYFVLEFGNGTLHARLNKKQWIAVLRGYGIRRVPVLHKPGGNDEWNGYNRPTRP